MQLFLHKKVPEEDLDQDQELVIIGSGPAGLTAAIYAARAQMSPVVIAGNEPGGQLMTTTEVENFPGFPDLVQGPDLVTGMRLQAQRLGTKFLEEKVIEVNLEQRPFLILTPQRQFFSRAIVIATGAEPRRLGLDSELRLGGRGLSYCATCDAPFFKGVNVAVVGAGDVAFEEALFLAKYASTVKIIYRGSKEQMRASKSLQKRAFEEPKISFLYNTEIVDILGFERVLGIKIINNMNNSEAEVSLGGLLIAIGYIPQTQLFEGKIDMKNGYIIHKKYSMTNIPGVFAAGDAVDYRYRQAITAAAQGCQAALDAEKWLQNPDIF